MPSYGEAERDAFYATLAYLARMLVLHGVPVIVDATANRRTYRDRARAAIPRFLEVHVRCPLAVCQARDPKGIYRRGAEGTAQNVPGVSAPYEPPLRRRWSSTERGTIPRSPPGTSCRRWRRRDSSRAGPGDATETG